MSIEIPGLSGEVGDLAKTAGLVGDDGGLNAAWFNDPLGSLRTILSNAPQRQALLRLLDTLLPPKTGADVPAGEKWHPLLEANAQGNAYVTVREEGGGIVVGIAGDYGTPAEAPPVAARLSATLPLVRAGASVTALPGTDDGPLVVRLRVVIDLVPGAGGGIALRAVSIEARATPSKFSLVLVLEGLSLEGEPASDRTLDPAMLGREAPELVAGLLKQVVAQAGPAVAQTVTDVVGLLGLADTNVPAFPLADLASNPASIQRWLASLFDGATPPINAWLEHFAGLFRNLFGAPPTVESDAPDSFSIALVPLGADSTLRLQAARADNAFRIGLAARLSTLVDGRRIAFQAAASLAGIPLAGTGRARVLPQAGAHLIVTGSAGDLVPLAAGFRIGALRAGLAWNGSALKPELELLDVHFANVDYPKLDLTNTDSVAAAASAAVTAAITAALGNSATALHIAALAGLAPPRDPADPLQPLPGWTRTVDAGRLVADPTGAIAAIHRAALVDATQSWDHLFAEVIALLPGLPGAMQGTGTPDDPWRVPLGPAIGALELQLAAWNAQTSGNAADEQRLRLGLRLAAASPPITFAWLAEVLAFDLPASGSARVGFVGTQSLRLAIAPAYDGKLFDDEVHATVASVAAQMSWSPGAPMSWRAGLENVRIEAGPDAITVASIAFPPAAGFDLSNPATAAASFGLTPETLEKLALLLVAQVASALGEEGREVAAFVGLHRFVEGLPDDWPTLANAGSPGRFLTDPLAALRDFVSRLFTTASADGTAFARLWIDRLRDVFGGGVDTEALALEGAGTYDEPWKLPFPDTTLASAAQLLVWLDPAGPPNALAAGLSGLANAVERVDELAPILRALGDHDDALRARLHLRDEARIGDGLALLADLLGRSDAVVPLASQQPTVGGWTSPDPIVATHWALPRDPNAIDLVGAQADALAGGSAAPRAVLLLAPELAGPDPWSALLAAASIHGTKDPNARFALDDRSIPDPLTFPLETVTAVADWYVGQLPDTDLPNWSRQAQLIGRMVDRIATLRPGVPVTIVAHSTAGLAARHYTASNQAKVKGLITLGTPHVGANLPFLLDADIADAIRIASLMRTDLQAGAIRDAIDALAIALDGWIAPNAAGELPRAARFPFAAVDATGSTFDVGDVPVHTIGAIVSADDVLDPLKAAVASFATRMAAVARAAPTHVGIGLSVALDLPAESDVSDITAEAYVRVDIVDIPISEPAVAPPRPSHGLHFSARIARTAGWLLGGPSTLPLGDTAFSDPRLAFVDVRLRDFEIGLDAHASASGIEAKPWIRLTDAALHGPTVPIATELDAITPGLVGELFQALSASADVVGAPATKLVDALAALGIVGPDPHGGVGLSSDAWTALQADAFGYIAARIPAVLANVDGWLGIGGPPDGPWTWAPADAPFELAIKRTGTGPYSIALRTSLALVLGVEPDSVPSDQAGSSFIEEHVQVALEVDVALPSLATSVQVSTGIGIVSLEWKSDAGTLTLRAPPWLDGLVLVPAPTAATLQAALSDLWPRLLFSGALSAALHAIAPTVNLAPLERFLRSSGDYLHELLLLADGSLDVGRITTLFTRIARLAGMPAGAMLSLPAGLTLAVDGAGTAADPLHVTLATSAPIAGVFEVASRRAHRSGAARDAARNGDADVRDRRHVDRSRHPLRRGPERRHAGSAAGRRNAADPIAADVRRAGRVARCCGSAAAARAGRARHRARHAAARVACRGCSSSPPRSISTRTASRRAPRSCATCSKAIGSRCSTRHGATRSPRRSSTRCRRSPDCRAPHRSTGRARASH